LIPSQILFPLQAWAFISSLATSKLLVTYFVSNFTSLQYILLPFSLRILNSSPCLEIPPVRILMAVLPLSLGFLSMRCSPVCILSRMSRSVCLRWAVMSFFKVLSPTFLPLFSFDFFLLLAVKLSRLTSPVLDSPPFCYV